MISRVTAAELRGLVHRLQPVYEQCFAAPPWNETPDEIAGYPERLARHAGRPGAYGYVAEESGQLAGAVYGWLAPAVLPDDHEHDATVRAAVTPAVGALLTAPAVVVTELMVAAAFRRRGVGRTLLARFIAGHPRAWLSTHPEAEAIALYESENWVRRAAYVSGGNSLVLFTREAPRTASQRSACGVTRPASPAPAAGRPPTRKY